MILSIKHKLNFDYLICIVFAILALLFIDPYFLWDTYRNGVFDKVKILIEIAFITALICKHILNNVKIPKGKLFVSVLLLVLWLQRMLPAIVNGSITLLNILGSVAATLILVFLFFLNDINIYRVYQIFTWLFAASLILGIVTWFLILFHGNIPYAYLAPVHPGKFDAGHFYQLYWGSVLWNPAPIPLPICRFCGIFDEPGTVGTIAALILASDRYRIRGNIKNVIILLGGIISFSTAFYVLTVLFIIMSSFYKNKTLFVLLLSSFFIIYWVFVYGLTFENPVVLRLQNALTIEDGQIKGDNRTDDYFDEAFNRFKDSSMLTTIFGCGHSATSKIPYANTYSYKLLIYDYGYLGFFLTILLLLIIIKVYMPETPLPGTYIFVICFFSSIYQRPNIINLYYIIILLGGIINDLNASDAQIISGTYSYAD